jgi:membrane protein implicated in regulation of membrane protease activity
MIVSISASILLSLSQWSEGTVVRGSLESCCASGWLKTLKGVRASLFGIFTFTLFMYAFSFYLIPVSLTPSTRASYILLVSFYFGLELGLLAFLAFLVILLVLSRDFIRLVCSREQIQENRG